MIDRRDVIRMKIPYPGISSKLAMYTHMYICKETDYKAYEYIKCQSLKPYMLVNNTMRHYWDEAPDIERNPFRHTTRIDCDKTFGTETVSYDDELKTTSRPDICKELFDKVLVELEKDGYPRIALDEDELRRINHLIN